MCPQSYYTTWCKLCSASWVHVTEVDSAKLYPHISSHISHLGKATIQRGWHAFPVAGSTKTVWCKLFLPHYAIKSFLHEATIQWKWDAFPVAHFAKTTWCKLLFCMLQKSFRWGYYSVEVRCIPCGTFCQNHMMFSILSSMMFSEVHMMWSRFTCNP